MRLLAFDIENASHYVKGSICSFGYVLVNYSEGLPFTEIERGDIIINPRCRVVDKHCKLVYPRSLYKSNPSFDKCEPQITGLIENADLVVGHAINSDIRFLSDAYNRFHLKMPSFKYVCTQNLYREYNKQINSIGIDTATALLDLADLTAHKAVDDAFVSIKLLEYLLHEASLSLDDFLVSLNMIYGEFSRGAHIQHYDGRHNRDLIFNEYIDCLKPLSAYTKKERRNKKKYCFDSSLITLDADYARNLVYSLIETGALYVRERISGIIDYYVVPEGRGISPSLERRIANANENGGHIKIITDKDVLAETPYLTREYPSDREDLRRLCLINTPR